MKKIKALLIVVALFGITTAITTKKETTNTHLLYYRVGHILYPIWGEPGEDYACNFFPIATCTYYYDYITGYYLPYENGIYVPLTE